MVIMRRSRGGDRGRGHPPPPPENHKNIGLLSNTGRDPLEIATQKFQASIQCWAIIGTPAYSAICILPPLKKNVKVGPPLTKLSGSAHGHVVGRKITMEFCKRIVRKFIILL